jgi:glycosyltransferase involved in cell wall biosynthesis
MQDVSPPLVTIGLVVRNGKNTIAIAIKSVLLQTFTRWQLLVSDDGSGDCTADVVESFQDPRIVLIRGSRSKGLAYRLNELITQTKTKYFARLDADDFCFPERLTLQVAFLEANPDVDLLGCGAVNFEGEGLILGRSRIETDHAEICREPWRGFPLYHPTWMGRTAWFQKHLYDAELARAQDFELLLRTYAQSRFACLSKALLGYRIDELSIRRQYRSRHSMFQILTRYGIANHNLRYIRGALAQPLKLVFETFAVISKLRYRVLGHRTNPVSGSDREAFVEAWRMVNSGLACDTTLCAG